jgi:hypothetical protein
MKKGLVFLVVVVVVASDDTEWRHAVEEVMASIALGPLRPGFGPDALQKRTREGAVRAQTNRLRARVVVAMVETLEEYVEVCVPEHVGSEAARAVTDELRAHNFTGAVWLRSVRGCPRGAIHVEVPEIK